MDHQTLVSLTLYVLSGWLIVLHSVRNFEILIRHLTDSVSRVFGKKYLT
jgi:hypothetical protein